jgi:predicted Zn-ribbon and HTH transcriptional regulator
MMFMKKMNMVEKYDAVMNLLNGKPADLSVDEAVEFLADRKEQVIKKNASGANAERKPTKTQLENEGIKAQIVDVLTNATEPMTIGEIGKAIGIESNQKVSALVTQMLTIRKGVAVEGGLIDRTEVKGKAYFALATKE